MTLRAYAERIDVNEKTVHTWKNAAEVAVLVAQNFSTLSVDHQMTRYRVFHPEEMPPVDT